jgi:hypothetical protein
MHQPVATCLAAALLSVYALAQEPAPQANLANKQALLQKALRKMDSLTSCAFTARLQNSRLTAAGNGAAGNGARPAAVALPPAPAGGMGGMAVATAPASTVVNIDGGWGGALLWASANEGRDRAVWHGRRMVGRQGEEQWRLRQGVVGDGVPMPKLFEPETFFQALLHSKHEVIHADVGALDDRPVEILTVSISGDEAYDVLWSGLIPDATTNSYLGTRSVAARGARAKLEIEIDVAVWLDPATSRVQQCKVRCYTKGAANAGGQVAVVAGLGAGPQPPGGVAPRPVPAPESAEQAPEAPAGPLVFQDGLPTRAPKAGQTLMVVSYDLTFANHEAAVAPAIDAAARALLGLAAGK